jgi:hypothetical protein
VAISTANCWTGAVGTLSRGKLVRAWVGGAVVLVLLVGIFWFTRSGQAADTTRVTGRTATSNKVLTTTSPLHGTFSAKDASQLATRLTSGNRATVESSMVLPTGQVLPASTVRALSTLAPLTINIGSFKLLAGNVATVTATTGHGTRWQLTIAGQANQWKLLDTKKVSS